MTTSSSSTRHYAQDLTGEVKQSKRKIYQMSGSFTHASFGNEPKQATYISSIGNQYTVENKEKKMQY